MSKHTSKRGSSTSGSSGGSAVRWGCAQHRTPAGQDCRWCAAQGVLFTRTDAHRKQERR